jgi:hypothetical protein
MQTPSSLFSKIVLTTRPNGCNSEQVENIYNMVNLTDQPEAQIRVGHEMQVDGFLIICFRFARIASSLYKIINNT